MAVTKIEYNKLTYGGEMVAQAVDLLKQAQDLLDRAKSLADSVSDGGLSEVLLEGDATSAFGVATGKGVAFYGALVSMKVNAATVTAAALADLDSGQVT